MNQYDVQRGDNPRLLFFFWIVFGATVILLLGLAWRQLVASRKYEAIERQQTERRVIKPGPRGDIYDRKGNLLVGSRALYSAVVYLDDLRPEFRREYAQVIREERARLRAAYEGTPVAERPQRPPVPDHNQLQWKARQTVIQRYVDQINRITGREDSISQSRIIRHFNEQLLLPLALVGDLKPDQYARLVEQVPVDSPIKIHTDTARYYPFGMAAAHTLGYVQSVTPDASELPDDGIKTFTFKKKVGKTGLERSFNEQLSGKTGSELWRVDPLGFQDTRLDLVPPRKGEDVVTSLDIDLQLAAETALGDRKGAAVALDVESGEVLTLASHPSYDLNDLSPMIPQKTFTAINERGAWLNRAAQLSYPPGSTFKLITTIAGQRAGTIRENTEHDCQGVYRVGNRVFRCHARNGHGVVDTATAIEGSCNVFYYAEGLKMGIDLISAEAKRFGLSEPTGIELPYETRRLVVPDKSWKRERIGAGWVPGDTANTAIGQGFLLVTPLQMATVIASIGRGETRTKPTLQALSREEAMAVNHGGEPLGLDPSQRAALYEGMERVVGPDGTGRLVQIDGLRIAGKTGTADFRAHGEEVNLAWFVGYAPAEDPQIAVAVMVEGASAADSFHGGSTAGPVAKDIFQEFIRQYPERAGF
ncbi:MAG: penicillin-binding transpeptidase domain-containing protein [Opitutales bacterium]